MALPIEHYPSEPFTFADLDAMRHDGRRRELIGGSLVVTPAPFGAHQWCAARLKRARYEALRVPAYWIVDPAGPSLTELRLSGGGHYTERSSVAGDQTFATDYPFPVELTPAALGDLKTLLLRRGLELEGGNDRT